jgi:hypothetical protein
MDSGNVQNVCLGQHVFQGLELLQTLRTADTTLAGIGSDGGATKLRRTE